MKLLVVFVVITLVGDYIAAADDSIPKIDFDSGMSYPNLARHLITQNPIFNNGERLSCGLLDPDKQYLVKFRNNTIPVCDVCPSFNQLLYQDRMIHQDPVMTLSDIDFPECFGTCVRYSANCVAFSHDSGTQICYQFNSTTDVPMTTESGVNTVIMTQPKGIVGEWTYTRNTKLEASNTVQFISKTFQDCMSDCDADAACRAVSYHFDSLTCNRYSDLKRIQSSLVIGYASAFKQSSFGNKAARQNFKLINEDLLTVAIANYNMPDKFCGIHSNSTSGAYYKPLCLQTPIAGCIVGTHCKACYYPERGGTNSTNFPTLDICPDSSGSKAKSILSQIDKHLGECLHLKNCFAVSFETTYLNPTFITASNANKMSGRSVVYVLNNFYNHYNLIPSSRLEKSNVQTGSEYFTQTSTNSLSDCVASCDSMLTCNRFSYVELTQTCTLSSADGMINLTDDGSEEVVAIREIPITHTGNRYTEIPGYTARPKTEGEYFMASRNCNSNCHQFCQDACNMIPNCTTVVMSQIESGIRCHLYSSGDLEMETEDFGRILYQIKAININREFLDTLPFFQSSDVSDCFDKIDHLSQARHLQTTNFNTKVRSNRGFWSSVGSFIQGAAQSVVDTVNDVVDGIKDQVQGVIDGVGDVIEWAGGITEIVLETAGNFIQSIVDVIKPIYDAIKEKALAIWNLINGGLKIIRGIKLVMEGASDITTGWNGLFSGKNYDLVGEAEHFLNISYAQSAEEVDGAFIVGDWDKVGKLGGEAAVGIATSFIPDIGRGGERGRHGGTKRKVDKEVRIENHSENLDKRSGKRAHLTGMDENRVFAAREIVLGVLTGSWGIDQCNAGVKVNATRE